MNYFRSYSPAAELLGEPPDVEEPITAEMFSMERLEVYAATLAREQEVSTAGSSAISLHVRLRSNSAQLGNRHAGS